LNSKIVVGTSIGLIAGLVLGVFIGVLFISPSGILPNKTGVGANNQVQVSGSIQESQVIEIEFISIPNGTIDSTTAVTNGGYRILLIGGQSYTVHLIAQSQYSGYPNYVLGTASLYVPSGVTYFTTANF
jgi:hypothetical protein